MWENYKEFCEEFTIFYNEILVEKFFLFFLHKLNEWKNTKINFSKQNFCVDHYFFYADIYQEKTGDLTGVFQNSVENYYVHFNIFFDFHSTKT